MGFEPTTPTLARLKRGLAEVCSSLHELAKCLSQHDYSEGASCVRLTLFAGFCFTLVPPWFREFDPRFREIS